MENLLTPSTANILFVYDNVLKSPDAFILKKVATEYRDRFEGFIDFSLIDTNTPESLLLHLVRRNEKNPLKWLATQEFDYDKLYNQLHQGFSNMYRDAERLRLYNRLYSLAASYCIEHIYIWNPEYDVRQQFDLDDILHENKVEYVVNPDLGQTILDIGEVNIVYDWDAERVWELVRTDKYDDTFFGIAGYPFNFEKDEPDYLIHRLWERSNIAFYPILNINETNKYCG
jgi:hypothetical protein